MQYSTTVLRLSCAVVLAAAAQAQPVNFNSSHTVGYFTDGVNDLVTADFNGDGKPDILASSPHQLQVLLGNGDGTFTTLAPFTATDYEGNSVAVGDFNGDGKLDLAVTTSANVIAVMLGNGDGTFQSPVDYGTARLPVFVTAADFNGDGKLDLAVAEEGSSNVAILLGSGDGTFQAAKLYPAEKVPISLAVADFNGDGKPDIAVCNQSSKNISILLGSGDGTFQKEELPHRGHANQRRGGGFQRRRQTGSGSGQRRFE